jgi:hypothetical protein
MADSRPPSLGRHAHIASRAADLKRHRDRGPRRRLHRELPSWSRSVAFVQCYVKAVGQATALEV